MKLSITLRRTNVLLLLCPLMLLTGCVTQQKPLVEYQTISKPKIPLPADLISPIEAPAPPDPMMFGDSVSLNAELYGLLSQCNIDRAAIRMIQSETVQQ